MEDHMATWKKITRKRFAGKASRTEFAVSRSRTGTQNATLIIPGCAGIEDERANVYSDGNGKLAFHFAGDGVFKVTKGSSAATSCRVSIPKDYAERIPFGVNDVSLTRDGDMYVLDLTQIGGGA
jgi:hypothetical protein